MIAEAMRRLGMVTSDLRQDSVRSLERALIQYIDSAAADADIRLRVSGDETWAPPAVIDEAFLDTSWHGHITVDWQMLFVLAGRHTLRTSRRYRPSRGKLDCRLHAIYRIYDTNSWYNASAHHRGARMGAGVRISPACDTHR